MDLKYFNSVVKRVWFILIFAFPFNLLDGQQSPLYPVSYRIFNPFIFNPAIAGSKDYFSADLIVSRYGESNSQIGSVNGRLSKPVTGYFSSPGTPEFTNIGIGGFFFNELNGTSRNVGISGTGSYHLQLDDRALSFLSLGISGKVIFNRYSGNPDLSDTAENAILPEFDAGIYYYSQSFFAGFSGTNLLGSTNEKDTLASYSIPISRQFFLQIGYKIVISKTHNILIEPSLVVNSDDTFSREVLEMVEPAIKLYTGNFCLGTYFNDFSKTSFFFQYKYPGLSVGAYFELPNNSPFYKEPLLAEIFLGINLSIVKSGSTRLNHW